MSAYLMNEQTIGLLAEFAVRTKAIKYGACYDLNLDLDKTVEALVRSNLLSLAVRSPDGADPAKDFADMSTNEFIAACKSEATRSWSVPIIEILKSCDCFAYQACEYDDWDSSIAYKILDAIRKQCISKLPG